MNKFEMFKRLLNFWVALYTKNVLHDVREDVHA